MKPWQKKRNRERRGGEARPIGGVVNASLIGIIMAHIADLPDDAAKKARVTELYEKGVLRGRTLEDFITIFGLEAE